MQTTGSTLQRLVSIGDKVFPEPLLGYVILSAVARVIDKYKLYSESKPVEGGFKALVRFEKVDICVTSNAGSVIRIDDYYDHILLTAQPSEKTTEFAVKSAFGKFITEFHFFVGLARAKPIPEFVTRVCRCHNQPVSFIKEVKLWDCSVDGLIYEEDTHEIMTDPFET